MKDSDEDNEYKKLVMVLCHDLNNSIGIIKNSIKLINKMGEHPHPKFAPTIDKIGRAIENVNELVTSIKDYEAIKNGKKEFELENVSFEDIINHTKFMFQDRAEEKSIKLIFKNEIPEDVFLKIEATSFKNSVIANLLSNAIKFTPNEKTIEVKGWLDGDQIFISVKDEGIGMPEDLIKKVFNPNEKTTRDGTSGEKGTGFGMPLVKLYLNKFNGDIRVDSKEKEGHPDDHGTTMIINLPVTKE